MFFQPPLLFPIDSFILESFFAALSTCCFFFIFLFSCQKKIISLDFSGQEKTGQTHLLLMFSSSTHKLLRPALRIVGCVHMILHSEDEERRRSTEWERERESLKEIWVSFRCREHEIFKWMKVCCSLYFPSLSFIPLFLRKKLRQSWHATSWWRS